MARQKQTFHPEQRMVGSDCSPGLPESSPSPKRRKKPIRLPGFSGRLGINFQNNTGMSEILVANNSSMGATASIPITQELKSQISQLSCRNQIVTITIQDSNQVERRPVRSLPRQDYAAMNEGPLPDQEIEEERPSRDETSNDSNEKAEAPTDQNSSDPSENTPATVDTAQEADQADSSNPGPSSSSTEQPARNESSARGSEGPFICQRCDSGFKSVDLFLFHFENEHCPMLSDAQFASRLTAFHCDKCTFTTTDEKALRKHRNSHFEHIKNALVYKEDGRYHCVDCNFNARSAITVFHHRKKHSCEPAPTNQGGMRCAHCSSHFMMRADLNRHMMMAHGKTSYHQEKIAVKIE